MTISYEQANSNYKEQLNHLLNTYGSWNAIPTESLREASETLRLHAIIESQGGKVTRQILSQYMIPESIITKVNPDFEGFEPKVKRAEKYDSVYKWLDDNPGVEVTTQDLCDITDMSYPTTLKFIENNPHYFRKVKRGLYEVRNPKVEREAEK